jgi:hypothetical protein
MIGLTEFWQKNWSRERVRLTGIVCLVLFSLALVILTGEQMSRSLTAAAGGLSASGGYQLRGAAGQPAAGLANTSSYRYCAGFWCGDARAKLYLPLVRK